MQDLGSKLYIVFLLISLCVLGACSKETDIPEPEEVVTEHRFSVQEIQYFMEEGDGIESSRVEKQAEAVQNYGPSLLEVDHPVEWDDLTKASQFMIDAETLPQSLDVSQVEVWVPNTYMEEGNFTYSSETFPLSTSLIEKPINDASNTVLHLKVPVGSRLIIRNSVEKQVVRCSFKLKLKNEDTGEITELTGKWEGTLGYGNYSTYLDEEKI